MQNWERKYEIAFIQPFEEIRRAFFLSAITIFHRGKQSLADMIIKEVKKAYWLKCQEKLGFEPRPNSKINPDFSPLTIPKG